MKTQTVQKFFSVVLLSLVFILCQSARVADLQIEIQVSPNVLNLLSQSEVVTVHTDIAYGLVDAHSVYLNGVLINSWKADDQGNFVAKFLSGAIKGLPLTIGGYNTLVLTGSTIEGESFFGSDEIKVVKNIPRK